MRVAGRGRVSAHAARAGCAKAIAAGGEVVSRVIRKPPLLPRGQLHFFLWDAAPDSSKAQRELGWAPTPLEEGLRRAGGRRLPESAGREPASRRRAVAGLLYESAADMYDRFAGRRERALRLLARAFAERGQQRQPRRGLGGRAGRAGSPARWPPSPCRRRWAGRALPPAGAARHAAVALAAARLALLVRRRGPSPTRRARASTSTPSPRAASPARRGQRAPGGGRAPGPRLGLPAVALDTRSTTSPRAPCTCARASTRWPTDRRRAACPGSWRSSSRW